MTDRRRWRNRIVGEGEEAPDQLLANPRQWKIHPYTQQESMAAVLEHVGWIQRVVVNRITGSVIDGHMRVGMAISAGEPSIPVVYVELSQEEEEAAIATFDQLTGMAGTDKEMLGELLFDVAQRESDETPLGQFVASLANGKTKRSEKELECPECGARFAA